MRAISPAHVINLDSLTFETLDQSCEGKLQTRDNWISACHRMTVSSFYTIISLKLLYLRFWNGITCSLLHMNS
jgi:hypothetical protein